MKDIKLVKIATASHAAYMVIRTKLGEFSVLGFIEKTARNSRTEIHPWKAFGAKKTGTGFSFDPATLYQTFYPGNLTAKNEAVRFLVKSGKAVV